MKAAQMFPLMVGLAGCAAGGGAQPAASPDDAERSSPGSSEPAAADECQHPDAMGPVLVSESVYTGRGGLDAVRFSELNSTKQRPLEECGLRTVLQRLATLTCDDGSNPFKGDLQSAHQSRAGNVGPGGRCDSILDRYEVPCPERSYSVYADMYLCTQQNAEHWLE